jgi:thioredoxin-like negative regulator of GroEL
MMELVKYGADWCSPCKLVDRVLEAEGVKHTKVDVEKNSDIASALKIRTVPVLIVYDGEKEVARHNSSDPSSVKAFLREHGFITPSKGI